MFLCTRSFRINSLGLFQIFFLPFSYQSHFCISFCWQHPFLYVCSSSVLPGTSLMPFLLCYALSEKYSARNVLQIHTHSFSFPQFVILVSGVFSLHNLPSIPSTCIKMLLLGQVPCPHPQTTSPLQVSGTTAAVFC